MPHRLTLRVTADLDEIWEYLIRQTGSEAIADRQIDAITNRIYLLSNQPRLGRARERTSVEAGEASRSATASLCTASSAMTCNFLASCMDAAISERCSGIDHPNEMKHRISGIEKVAHLEFPKSSLRSIAP
jgi:plasmid stabilization system protein ParE